MLNTIMIKKKEQSKIFYLKTKLASWGYSTNLHNIKENLVDVNNFE